MNKPQDTQSEPKVYSQAKAFLLSELLPDVSATFGTTIRSIDDVIKSGDVVLDTNVLLLPYGAGAESLKHIVEIYKALKKDGRLFVPAQVAREFIKNRPLKIAELYTGIKQKLSKFLAPDKLSYPILEGIAEFRALNDAVEKVIALRAEVIKANTALLKKVRSWEWNDPVSQAYKEHLVGDVIVEPKYEKGTFLEELQKRYELAIPPGYKDASKEDHGIGDLMIWKTILAIGEKNKKDLIFVSGD